ncbi:LuxR family transcriptional regulator [uncultured Aquitalea sp.]|uniref:helix-turn-helix transcriptional regulator n=1 Tax=uncultured Aquitalea sp. TaxID=540272 RepID=UPI0025F83299|nr:LuxR family transcriptional regulator [uncultured Aquitalea sp.]
MLGKPQFARPLPGSLPLPRQCSLLDWIHTCGQIDTGNELRVFLEYLQSQLPVRHMALVLARLNAQQCIHRMEMVLNISFPPAWVERYQEERMQGNDPVMRSVMGRGPINWQERFVRSRARQEKEFIEAVRQQGFEHGVTLSHLCERLNIACVLVMAGQDITRDLQLIDMVDSLLPHLHKAAARVANLAPALPETLPLSQREYDIFHWMSQGKTNWEIATILGISERTAKFHVANIIRKLGANNRTHAIVLGLHRGIFTQPLAEA